LRFLLIYYASFFPAYLLAPHFALRDAVSPAFAWDANTPYLDMMALPYLSVLPAFMLPLVLMRAADIRKLGPAVALCAVVAAVTFILVPTRASLTDAARQFGPLVSFIRLLDMPSNFVPSLHVAYGTLLALACAKAAPLRTQVVLFSWLALMSASTLLTHQHYMLDVVSGALLGVLAWWMTRSGGCAAAQAAQEP
jgi:membrane-associated phospholipid phosphatase